MNPLLDGQPRRRNPLLEDEEPQDATRPFDPTVAPTKNAFGRFVDPIIEGGKTAVGTILEALDKPQNAMQGAILEGAQGFKRGLTHEKDYTSEDLLTKAGWQGDGLGKKAVGLAADLVFDPLNLAGLGIAKKGLKAVSGAVGTVAEKLPGAKFVDPHAGFKTEGLKDFARLKESELRSTQNIVHEDVANALALKHTGPLVKTADDQTLRKIAYHIDEGMTHLLKPEEQVIAQRFTKALDDQWASELASGHQGQQLTKTKGPAPKLQDYVPYVTKPDTQKNVSVIPDIKGTTRFSKARTIPNLATAVSQHGATDHLGEMLTARLISGRKAQKGAEILEQAAQKWGSATPAAGMRKLNIPQDLNVPSNRVGALKDTYLPEEVAQYLEKYHVIANKPEDIQNVWQNAMRTYKSWLVTNPQQAATNFLGNAVNSFLSGNVPSVKNMRLSAAIVRRGAIPPAIKGIPGDQIVDAMRRYEIVGGQGQYQDIFSKGKNYSWNPLKPNNVLSRTSQHFNQHYVEEPFKVAQFLQELEKGKSLDEAAISVKNTFFDYAEISDEAKWLRDNGVAPFITWQLKNIPFQIKNLIENPHKFAQTESLYEAIDDDYTVVPHQDQREGLIPVGDNKTLRIASPINDLNKLPIGSYEGRDLLIDTIGGMLPPIKSVYELATNQKIYNQRPIFNENDPGAIPMDAISNLMQRLDNITGETGLPRALVGIGPDEYGQERQNELLAYLLQQNPWQYYGRNIFNPPQELLDKGAMEPIQPVLSKAGAKQALQSATGFRTKKISDYQQNLELEKRLKQILAP